MTKAWWDDTPYYGSERQPFSMTVEAEPKFKHPVGFVQLRERYRIQASGKSVVNSVDRHCRISKVKLK
ncbi:hypothetical protein CKA34_10625 [Rhizobium sp. 11515TR]|nr:hypothetical protein CKA34_10625 [Rhizobium sp. 11515TR]